MYHLLQEKFDSVIMHQLLEENLECIIFTVAAHHACSVSFFAGLHFARDLNFLHARLGFYSVMSCSLDYFFATEKRLKMSKCYFKLQFMTKSYSKTLSKTMLEG